MENLKEDTIDDIESQEDQIERLSSHLESIKKELEDIKSREFYESALRKPVQNLEQAINDLEVELDKLKTN